MTLRTFLIALPIFFTALVLVIGFRVAEMREARERRRRAAMNVHPSTRGRIQGGHHG